MKKFLIYALSLLFLTSALSSCDDVLNIDPTDRYATNTVWSSQAALDQYLIGFYAILKEGAEIYNADNFTDAYTDIMKSSSWDMYSHPYNKVLLQEGSFTSDNAGAFECWSSVYERIRRYNEFFRDAEKYGAALGEDFMKVRKAEVYFMRGYAYYKLARVYGGVVLRTSLDGPEQNDKPRATEADTWAQVIADLTAAAENLPEKWEETNTGRVTKAAAYGLISRVALYAKDWEIAISAANECATYGGQLYTAGSNPYDDVMNDSANPEHILVVSFAPGYSSTGLSHRAESFFRPRGDSKLHNNAPVYSAFGPTSELVDSYQIKNASGDWEDFSWATHGNDPYTNRDPRFYSTVLYNGAKWEGREIETFVGGVDGLIEFEAAGATSSTTTGYYFKKFLIEYDTRWETQGSSKFGILIRYAEVLLNKAEALAEADWGANNVEALAALNEIRARVGLDPRTAANKEEFMKYLQDERKLELAGEGFRYWDLRRWRLAEDVLNGTNAHGVKITNNAGTLTYEQINVDQGMSRVFPERYYAFSIPITERSNNTLFGENNPGW